MRILIYLSIFGLTVMSSYGVAQSQNSTERGISTGADREDAEDTRPIGLRVSFNRPEPIYAVGDQLGLTISTDRNAIIEIWELDAAGKLNKILPARGQIISVGPGKPLKLPMAGQNFVLGPPIGTTELHVIARSAADASRAVDSADARLAGRSKREDVKLSYRIVAR